MGSPSNKVVGALYYHCSLIWVQAGYAGYHVLCKYALTKGVDQLLFCFTRDTIAFLVLIIAAQYEGLRGRAVPLPSINLLGSLFMLGLLGICANQLLFLAGLQLTSPAVAAAVQPSIPVFTFLLAIFFGLETVVVRRRDGQLKVLGVMVCVGGALLVALWQGPPVLQGLPPVLTMHPGPAPTPDTAEHDSYRIIGVLCLLGNCLCMSGFLTNQVYVLKAYPYAILVTAWSYFFGAAIVGVVALARAIFVFGAIEQVATFQPDTAVWIAIVYAALIPSALNYILLAKANQAVGPATVSLYMPLQPLLSSLLSHRLLGSPVYTGSAVGGLLILSGLYLVIWGRADCARAEAAEALESDPVFKEHKKHKLDL